MIIRAANIDTNIDTIDAIFNKTLQILKYTDDLGIIPRDIRSLTLTFDSVTYEADDIGLQMHIFQTKYIFSIRNKRQKQLKYSLILSKI